MSGSMVNPLAVRRRTYETLKVALIYIVLTAAAVLFVLPVLWTVLTSFKTDPQAYRYPPEWWPRPWTMIHYIEANSVQPLGRFYVNSLVVTAIIITGQLITSSMGAFAFSRIQWKARDALFVAYLATMMIPFYVRLIPLYLIMKDMGLLDTYWALIIPWLATPYGTFLLRQFFLTIPVEYEEAARIEGFSTFRIYRSIIVPLSKTAIITLGTLTFAPMWNMFVWPVVVISTTAKKTLPAAVAIFNSSHGTEWTMLMAASVIMVIPLLIIFLFSQRFFIRGITLTGLKG